MRQKDINIIRDKAVASSKNYPCEEILKEKGLKTIKRGVQVYTHCYRCGNPNSDISDRFSVNTSRNMYHCFGCGEGGGPAKLFSQLFNIPYIDSALTLALRLGSITEEEFKKASSSADAIAKFSKGQYAIKELEEAEAQEIEVKAPSNICNIVYSHLIKMSEFSLSEEYKKYLINERNLTEEEIREIDFFTYVKTFNVDTLVAFIKMTYPNFNHNHLYGVPGFFFEKKTEDSGVWHFKKPMPNCIGIPLRNYNSEIVALQMRNMSDTGKHKYFYVSSKYESKKNKNYGYGSSSGSPVAVIYPKILKIPTFYVGEGIFKMYQVSKEGAVTFSVQGVNALAYVADEIKSVLKSGNLLKLPTTLVGQNEMKIVIVFDMDMFEKIQVLEAGLKASMYFSNNFPNKPISFLLWKKEYGKGIDDMKFYCENNNMDFRKKVRVMDKDTFVSIVREAVSASDEEYVSLYGPSENVEIRRTKEYSDILDKNLYLNRIKPLLP